MEEINKITIVREATITGNFLSRDDLDFEGLIYGDIHVRNVVIRPFGKVNGSIIAEQVVVQGTVIGNIRAFNIALTCSAHVEGDLHYTENIRIEIGSLHKGGTSRHETKPF